MGPQRIISKHNGQPTLRTCNQAARAKRSARPTTDESYKNAPHKTAPHLAPQHRRPHADPASHGSTVRTGRHPGTKLAHDTKHTKHRRGDRAPGTPTLLPHRYNYIGLDGGELDNKDRHSDLTTRTPKQQTDTDSDGKQKDARLGQHLVNQPVDAVRHIQGRTPSTRRTTKSTDNTAGRTPSTSMSQWDQDNNEATTNTSRVHTGTTIKLTTAGDPRLGKRAFSAINIKSATKPRIPPLLTSIYRRATATGLQTTGQLAKAVPTNAQPDPAAARHTNSARQPELEQRIGPESPHRSRRKYHKHAPAGNSDAGTPKTLTNNNGHNEREAKILHEHNDPVHANKKHIQVPGTPSGQRSEFNRADRPTDTPQTNRHTARTTTPHHGTIHKTDQSGAAQDFASQTCVHTPVEHQRDPQPRTSSPEKTTPWWELPQRRCPLAPSSRLAKAHGARRKRQVRTPRSAG